MVTGIGLSFSYVDEANGKVILPDLSYYLHNVFQRINNYAVSSFNKAVDSRTINQDHCSFDLTPINEGLVSVPRSPIHHLIQSIVAI